jgi:hypothetical protein
MRILSLLIFYVLLVIFFRAADSPHGKDFKISCNKCHSSKGWQFDKEIYSFDHTTTKLPLTGQHTELDCRQCHPTLIFKDAKNNCIDCHKDVHQGTTGMDCSRCHTPASWLVNNITRLHEVSRFPLLGVHKTADCSQCHKSENLTRFDVPGVNCIDCHRQNYMATTNPNHVQAGFSEDCSRCHHITSFQWNGAGFNHNIFPLVQGHSTAMCADCHKTTNFTDASPVCYSCHQQNYLATTNPNHNLSKFSTNCHDCHSLNPGWKPTNFDHSRFPLKLGHAIPACIDCHTGGNYTSTPTDCYSCHQTDYNSTINPNHQASGFSVTCTQCHSTNPGWKPATFNHNNFPLTQGHASIACADCHKGGNYSSTSADCFSCHQVNYNNTVNPNHKTLNFSTTCKLCHTTTPGWKPAAYTQHDSQFFPIYSGKHRGQWSSCTECHTNPANYTLFDCIRCHKDEHKGKNYSNVQCYNCHPRGSGG